MNEQDQEKLEEYLEALEDGVIDKVTVTLREQCPEHIANFIVGNIGMIADILEPIVLISRAIERVLIVADPDLYRLKE